ncbi:MAG: hypothetical protein K6G52_02700 [Treponemataceae bacterium]|nr:hypothetical protein [Treponemataceae bacterium]
MSDILSNVERELVIKYISQEKPEIVLKRCFDLDESNQNAVFAPLQIDGSSYSVQDENIILKRKSDSRILADNSPVIVNFYYKGRAMYFESRYCHYNAYFIIPINDKICKFLEQTNGIYDYLTCDITPSGAEVQVDRRFTKKCVTNENFLLFKDDGGAGTVAGSIGGAGTLETNIQKFFSFDFHSESNIQNRILPPIILYLGDEFMVVASENEFFRFEKDTEYKIELSIPQVIITREIECTAVCSKIVSDSIDSEKKCFFFDFRDMKPEDIRFLYEKSHQEKYV